MDNYKRSHRQEGIHASCICCYKGYSSSDIKYFLQKLLTNTLNVSIMTFNELNIVPKRR